jgi:tagaturonate reductase
MSEKALDLPILQQQTRAVTERALQFGDGNFLRGYIDWMFDRLNEEVNFDAGIHVVQPRRAEVGHVLNKFKEQNHTYTVLLRGLKRGERSVERRVITSVLSSSNAVCEWPLLKQKMENPDLRFIVSNTTEAGIVYSEEAHDPNMAASTFPAKITALLHHRFLNFSGAEDKGLLFLPCELIEANGDQLKEIVLTYARDWNLGEDFMNWIHQANHFANTLVDRIVPGFPKDEIYEISQKFGYRDDILVCGEPYHLLAIQGDDVFSKELPFSKTDMNVVFTDDLQQYRSIKVKVLNGVHTMSVLLSHLMGNETVKETLDHQWLNAFILQGALGEISPTIDMDEEYKSNYIYDVLERFSNPFMKHLCLSISLNSIAKFKVRVLPTLLESMSDKGGAPACLSLSFAALIQFYKVSLVKDGVFYGETEKGPYVIQDDPENLNVMQSIWDEHSDQLELVVKKVLAQSQFWGQDLSSDTALVKEVTLSLETLTNQGGEAAIRRVLEGNHAH